MEPTENPMGTDGFEFVEYAASEKGDVEKLFLTLGFTHVATHRSKNVKLYRQGDIHFILNSQDQSQAHEFFSVHGPSANAMAFRVKDVAKAIDHARTLGLEVIESRVGPMELNIPAIRGIGGSLLYLVDRYGDHSIYDIDFVKVPDAEQSPKGNGLLAIDHLTHNVYRGHMDEWADYYTKLFNFRQIRYFDIEGIHTGLHSRAMISPCHKIRIPINESADDESQIEEYLREYKGEGIQHIALSTDDIYTTVETLKAKGIRFMEPPPDTYYEQVETRLPGHGEDIARLKKLGILIDGEAAPAGSNARPRLLLQIFTATVIGPIFFEIIQRKGDEGFGEGNFQALFESMEADQVRRGVIKTE